jgi:hypothetical protein
MIDGIQIAAAMRAVWFETVFQVGLDLPPSSYGIQREKQSEKD